MKNWCRQFDGGCVIRSLAFFVLIAGSSFIAFLLHQQPYDDLPSFYWATRLVFDNTVSPYQPEYFQEIGRTLDRKIYPFLYPPPSLIIFSPFLLVDYPQAKIIFSLLNLFLWWFLAWAAYRFYCTLKRSENDTWAAVVIFSVLLVFAPVIDTIRTGQVNLIVIACLIPLMCNHKNTSAQICTGVFLAVAVLLKVYLLLLLPLVVLLRAWKTLLASVIALVMLSVISLLVMPPSVWGDWIILSQQGAGYGKLMPQVMTLPWNQSVNGFLLRLVSGRDLDGWHSYWPSMLFVVAVILVIWVYFVAARYSMSARCGTAIAVALVLALVNVIAPLTWLHHFVFIVPAIISGVYFSESLPWLKIALMVAIATLGVPSLTHKLFGLPLPWPESGHIGFISDLAMSIPLITGIFFLLLLLVMVQKKPTFN